MSVPAAGALQLLQCAAEDVPLESESQDVVYCVYLFHEMPLQAQRAALAEFSRLLKPGGLLVITDSIQLGDRKNLTTAVKGFSNFNEPHYSDYAHMNFGEELKRVGLQPDLKCLQSVTKSVSAVKPLE